MIRIPIYQMAHIIDHAFKQMKEYKEVLISDISLLFSFALALILHLKHLCPDVSKRRNIGCDCSYRLIHLNNLFKHEFFLPGLHKCHYFGAVHDEILLPLELELLGLF